MVLVVFHVSSVQPGVDAGACDQLVVTQYTIARATSAVFPNGEYIFVVVTRVGETTWYDTRKE
jgi:hypothetical protein